MAKSETNRFGEMEAFVRVVELGGFSAAARHYRKSPSAISKLIARLEARLKIRLFNRSTRQLQLTAEGNTFYEHSMRLLADLNEAELSILDKHTPTGHLRVTTNIPVGRHFLLPIIPQFLAENSGINVDITLTDKVIDLMEEYTDVAIRSGTMKDSTLIARKLGEARMTIVAAPNYIKRYGLPKTAKDLAKHNLIRLNFARTQEAWPLLNKKNKITIKPQGNILVSDGEAMRQLAISGVGLTRIATFQVKEDIAAGRLVTVLENLNPGDVEPLYAVFLGQGGYLPARIRVFLDFLVAKIQV